MKIRVGTRGSDLALWQTGWVCDELRLAHPGLEIETVTIKTHGDLDATSEFGTAWPVGAFVSALENALLEKRVDFAVHSFKDLQTAETGGLVIAAIPPREVVNDVLLSRDAIDLNDLPPGFRVGTGSPRRSAQFAQLGNVEIVPIRGNVLTRINKIESEGLDGVILAAAGLKRLGIEYPNITELPVDRFVPSPAQGALAIQSRADSEATRIIAVLDHEPTRRQVVAERAFLQKIEAGCHTPVGALATILPHGVNLHAQLFDASFEKRVEDTESGGNAVEVGRTLALRLLEALRA